MTTNSKIELSYASGIFDGEGNIQIYRKQKPSPSHPQRRSPTYSLRIKVKMTHRPTIEYLKSMFEVGTVAPEKPGKNNKKVSWKWCVSCREAVRVIELLEPYLVTKKDEAKVALEFSKIMDMRTGKKETP